MNNTISISDARATFPNLIARVYDDLERFFITVSGKPKAAIMSIEELESLEETAEILAIPGAKENQVLVVSILHRQGVYK